MKILFLLFISYVLSVEVYESCVAKGEYEKVWKKIGNFADLRWVNPDLSIEIDYPNNGFLPRRTFRFGPAVVKENLISAQNGTNLSYVKYDFQKEFEAFKVDNYVAKLSAQRSTFDKTTFVSWEANFDLRKNEEGELEKVKGLFRSTIEQVSKMDFGN